MKTVLAAAGVAAMLGVCAWTLLYRTALPPDLSGDITSVSYNFAAPDEREVGDHPEERLAGIDRDLALISEFSSTIRLYSASGIYEAVPQIARNHDLAVTLGAWVEKSEAGTKRELDAAIAAANRNMNVRAVVVGNETILRKELTVPELIDALRYVRRRVHVPVTTGETWDIWLKYPELVREVDYIAAHILPYWEGIPADHAVTYAMERYDLLRNTFPGKKVVIAEFGWPSQGYNNKAADTGALTQARVLREFIVAANNRGLPYNIIEAFDQPWKANEGSVGAYWGLYDADRVQKFPLNGVVRKNHYVLQAALGIGIGLLVTLAALRRRPTFAQALVFATAAQALAAGVSLALFYPLENYLDFGAAIAWATGVLLMLPLTAMTLVKIHEVAEVTFGRRPTRLIANRTVLPEGYKPPKVSVHIPAYKEDPEMLIATLNSVAALDYPDFEALVIVNNTPEEEFWRPIEAHCRQLGERFKFVFLPKVAGFKAGALNTAMPQMAPDAEFIAMLDADYVVHPDWLKDLIPTFLDEKVAMVQAPQDHRDGHESRLKQVMNSEYAGFFDIGMVQRNEDDAIIVHGTMLLIRRSAFEAVGGWNTDTITEDTELGLRLLAAGWTTHYTNRRYGWGLLPDTYKAFKTQRDRWAFGAVQIIKKHLGLMRPWASPLTPAQRFHFITGWSFWLSDSFGVLAAYLNLLWVPMILFVGVLIPTLPFTVPILAAFAVNLLHCGLLYALRVRLPRKQILGAALAAMSLQFTVARAVARGLWGAKLAFLRTEKGGLARLTGRRKSASPVRPESITGLALLIGALALHYANETQMLEIDIFAATLVIQSLPFLAAPLMYAIERFGRRQAAEAAPRQLVAASQPGSN